MKKFQSGDKVRLTHDVGSSFYERNEIYITGTKGSIATVIISKEYFLLRGKLLSAPARSKVEESIEEGTMCPVRYERLVPLSVEDTLGFDIIDHCREGEVDLISIYNLEKVE